MKTNTIAFPFLGLCILLTSMVGSPTFADDVETPTYTVLHADKPFEIRYYDPMIIATTTVDAERIDAANIGFRRIAKYIFGENSTETEIAMTAPVKQQPVVDDPDTERWTMSFVMPSQYSMDTLPRTTSPDIALTPIEPKQFVVIRFSGSISEKNLRKHKKKLIDYAQKKGVTIKGEAKYAFYNPPWTLPFFRRNEVMFELAEDFSLSNETNESKNTDTL